MLAHRARVAVGLLCGLGLLALSKEWAAADDEKAKAAEAKQTDISKLPNDDLLKLANAIFGERQVIDDTLADGHALWVADIDGDGDDEVFAGHRGKDHRVSAYDFDGQSWRRTVLGHKLE